MSVLGPTDTVALLQGNGVCAPAGGLHVILLFFFLLDKHCQNNEF